MALAIAPAVLVVTPAPTRVVRAALVDIVARAALVVTPPAALAFAPAGDVQIVGIAFAAIVLAISAMLLAMAAIILAIAAVVPAFASEFLSPTAL